MTNHNTRPDEETPLLQAKTKTLVPWSQIIIAYIALIAEPISSTYTFPFINQLIGELGITGGDDRKIGYYTGLIDSFFYASQAITTWQWSRLSDFVGRRPIILTGLMGVTVSIFAFGLSRTLVTLIVSRCIAGFLDSNFGIVKSILGDSTDHTNMAQPFSLIPAIFCIGATIAPLYGGALVKPQERWPSLFQGEFWATYPYFLPSLISGCFTLLAFLICAMFLQESLPLKAGKQPQSDPPTENPPLDSEPSGNNVPPIPMSIILKTPSIMLPIVIYALMSFIDIGILVLVPLFWSSPIEIGGLGLSPPVIGTFLAILRTVDGIVQATLCPKLIEWLGAKRVFCWTILFFYPLLLLFPIMSTIVSAQGTAGPIIMVLLVVQLITVVIMDISFPIIFIFVTRSAPNRQSLGSVNGVSQSFVSIARAIGPALTTSMFALSKEYNVLGGNLVYVILAILITILVFLSGSLPELEDEE